MKLFKMQRALYSKPEREMTEKDYEKLIQATRREGNQLLSPSPCEPAQFMA